MKRLTTNALAAVVLAGILTLSGIGGAYAYFSGRGTGTGAATVGSTAFVTLGPATVTAALYPGGSATVALTITNPNPAAVQVAGLALDTSQGTGGFAVDPNHTGCGLDAFTFPTQTNGGAGWTIPAGDPSQPGSLTITLPSSVTASPSTVNACQGAALTVYLRPTGISTVRLGYSDTVLATSGLVDYYRLGEAAGSTTAVDTKNTGNNGTYSGGPALGTAGAIRADSNTAATFDGVDDYAQIPRSISTDFSIELWFKSTKGIGTSNNWYNGAGLVDAEVTNVTNDFGTALMQDGRVCAGTGNPDTSICSAAGYTDGAWHHVVFTRTSTGNLTLYLDGTARATGTGSTNALTASNAIRIGAIQTGINYYTGSIDEVALYTTALPATTITNHYRTGTG